MLKSLIAITYSDHWRAAEWAAWAAWAASSHGVLGKFRFTVRILLAIMTSYHLYTIYIQIFHEKHAKEKTPVTPSPWLAGQRHKKRYTVGGACRKVGEEKCEGRGPASLPANTMDCKS